MQRITVMGLFNDAVANVRDNITEALRFSGVIFILSVLVTSALNVMLIGEIAAPPIDPQNPDIPPEVLTAMLVNAIILFVIFAWVAIEWHRFALANVRLPSILPTWETKRVFSYVGNMILLGIMIAMVVAFPFGIIIAIMTSIGLAEATAFLPFVMLWVAYYVMFRAGLVLPAAALDAPMKLSDSMRLTGDFAGALWGLAGLQLAVSFFGILITSLLPTQSVLGVVVSGAVNWFLVLLSASLLSSVYKASQKE
ncbi:MAG: hypothetical protein AAF429_04390 [Pseudomonadota bacterium]